MEYGITAMELFRAFTVGEERNYSKVHMLTASLRRLHFPKSNFRPRKIEGVIPRAGGGLCVETSAPSAGCVCILNLLHLSMKEAVGVRKGEHSFKLLGPAILRLFQGYNLCGTN